MKKLVPDNDNRKTYFLTEFLPVSCRLMPNKKNDENLAKFLLQLNRSNKELKNKIDRDINERESDKGDDPNKYKLKILYEALFKANVELRSIEDQTTQGDEAFYKKLISGDLPAYEKRVNNLNKFAAQEAISILKKDATARILIFAGMGHIANSTCKKFNTKSFLAEGEKSMEEIGRAHV